MNISRVPQSSRLSFRPRWCLFFRHISEIECIEFAVYWEGATGDAVREHTLYDTSALPSATMALNPNFFPNGYQDPKHPEEEVVTNWVRREYSYTLNIHS